jgi:hypothetical protein
MKTYVRWLVLTACLMAWQLAFAQNFGLSATLPVGANINSVGALDLNGDGKVDLVSANFGSSSITIWTNNGSGGFGSNATVNLSVAPWAMTTADVNGDGRPDVITINNNGPPITVFTNNGQGGFGLSAQIPFGALTVTAADTKGTGKLDLISAGPNSTVIVLTNNGFGMFGSNASYTVYGAGFSANSIAAADMNGDGKVDLIIAGYYGTELTVLTNNGVGGFVSNATYTAGNDPQSVAASDVNGDGKPDVICVNHEDNTITVFTNNGIGILVSNATYAVGSGAYMVTTADINGDGHVDLITANLNDGTESFTILTNDGTGKFVAAPLPGPINSPWCVLADVNGDGKPDLIGAMYESGELAVYTNFYTFPPFSSKPALTIQRAFSNTAMRVSWPSGSAGWSLRESTNLTAAKWSLGGYDGYPVTDNGVNQSLIVVPAPGKQFFRLMHP